MIGYDLNKPGQDYSALFDAIKDLSGSWWHYLDSTWLVKSDLSSGQIRDRLAAFMDASDELLVIDVTAREMSWRGFESKAAKWILDNYQG